VKIESLAVEFPSRIISNKDIIEMIALETEKQGTFSGDLKKVLKIVEVGLKASGSATRRWLAPDETSVQITVQACKKALSQLDPKDNKVDLLIVASVYADLVEPAAANLIAHEIGLDDVECFDVKEACDGWMKATKIASSFIESGQYRRIMVVNAEFGMTPGCGSYPDNFGLDSVEQLEWRFPAFTIGEVATATILSADQIGDKNPWRFTNSTRNDLFDLCSLTNRWNGDKVSSSVRVARDKPGLFTSYWADLQKEAFPLAFNLFKASAIQPEKTDILFTHSSSKKNWSKGANMVGLGGEKFYDIYTRFGNVVSAAIPAAMAVAFEEGKLKRGHRVAAWVASAGMSFSTAAFTF